MNRPRSQRKKRDLSCCRCGGKMSRAIAVEGERQRQELAAQYPKAKVGPLVHCCGDCRKLHWFKDGKLVALTAAEEFDVRVKNEETMNVIDNARFPTDGGGSLIIADKKR